MSRTTRRALSRSAPLLLPPRLIIRRGTPQMRRLAITFDHGPDPLTRLYLDALDQLGVVATFFLVGRASEERPDDVLEMVRRGHAVGYHGAPRRPLPELGSTELRMALADGATRLPAQEGRPMLRPPYGALSPRVLAACARAGFTVVLWSTDSQDWLVRDPGELVARVSPERIAPGDIILFHEGKPWTLAALPRIIRALIEDDYEFVTLPQLLATA
jgi:peptidoglycan-N-acetylglucosamine deacetylase